MLILIFLFLFASQAGAATYYVNKSGNNSNSCATAQSPIDANAKLTIAAGLACITTAGNTLIVGDGTYLERITHDQLVSGTAAAPNIIKAENRLGAIIQPPVNPTNSTGIWVYGKSWLIFDGFVVDGTNLERQGVLINRNASGVVPSNITLRYMEVKNVKGVSTQQSSGTCIQPRDGATNITISHLKIHDCGANDPGFSHGIYLTAVNSIVEHTEIYNTSGHGVHGFSSGAGIYNNNIVRYNLVRQTSARGILIGSGANNLAHHNIVIDAGTAGIAAGFGAANNSQIYNNTVYSGSQECIEVRSSSVNAQVKNNLCLQNATNTVTNLGTGTTGSCGNNGNVCSTSATLVIDVATSRFSPRESSALIDGGAFISGFSTGKFVGSVPDVGALEAPIFSHGSVESGDSTNVRFNWTIAAQGIRSGTGLSSCNHLNFAVTIAGAGATENSCGTVQTAQHKIGVAVAVTTGQSITGLYTRPTTGGITDNTCISGEISVDGCKNAEIRTTVTIPTCPSSLPACFTNSVVASAAVLAVLHSQCLDVYSTVASPILVGVEDADCRVRRGGWFALAFTISNTVAAAGSKSFEMYHSVNGGTATALTNSGAAAFGVHTESGFMDNEVTPTAILTNALAYLDGKVLGQQSTNPTVDFVINSATTVIVLGKFEPTATVGDRYCFEPRLIGGTAITYTELPCVEVTRQASRQSS